VFTLRDTLIKVLQNADAEGKMEGDVKQEHSIALELRKSGEGLELVGYHASGALHSTPTVLNVIVNIMLSATTGSDEKSFRLYAINEPFPTQIVMLRDFRELFTLIMNVRNLTNILSLHIFSSLRRHRTAH
jgi:hypothetical protein